MSYETLCLQVFQPLCLKYINNKNIYNVLFFPPNVIFSTYMTDFKEPDFLPVPTIFINISDDLVFLFNLFLSCIRLICVLIFFY